MGFDSWCSKHTKTQFEQRGGGSGWVYRSPKRLKLSTQEAVRNFPYKGDTKGTELSPQTQQEKKILLRLLHPLIFNFPILHLIPLKKKSLLRAPIPAVGWQPGGCTQNTLSSLRGLSGLFFFFNFQNNSVYRKQTVVLGFVFLFFSQLPCTLRALRAQKRGCSSWRAHHPFTRSCHRNSAHTPTMCEPGTNLAHSARAGWTPQG